MGRSARAAFVATGGEPEGRIIPGVQDYVLYAIIAGVLAIVAGLTVISSVICCRRGESEGAGEEGGAENNAAPVVVEVEQQSEKDKAEE